MRVGADQKHLFYLEMSKLLEAGFDIRKAAQVLRDTQLPAAQAHLLKDLEGGLQAGESIASAYGKDVQTITHLERIIISAGERGGKLAPAFQHLASYFAMLATARRDIWMGMLYPLVILHLGIFIAVVPSALMLGRLSVMEIGRNLLFALLLTYAGVGAVLCLIRWVVRLARTDAATDRLLRRIPWIGKARENFVMARFCQVYHSCLLAGLSMQETVALSTEAAQGGAIRSAGSRLAGLAKTGDALGPGFISELAFPRAFARSYATGEEAGTLDTDLARWTRVFQENAASSARLVAVMVPKFLYVIILLFVAWHIIQFFNGYYGSMLDSIQE